MNRIRIGSVQEQGAYRNGVGQDRPEAGDSQQGRPLGVSMLVVWAHPQGTLAGRPCAGGFGLRLLPAVYVTWLGIARIIGCVRRVMSYVDASHPDVVGFLRERWAPLAMAATVVLAVGAVLVLGQNKQLEAAFVAQLAIDHDRCFRQLDDLIPDFDSNQAARVLASDQGLDVGVPDESADFDLFDVRQCLYGQGGMAHVLCEWRGQALSLFVVPGRSDREQELEIVGHEALV